MGRFLEYLLWCTESFVSGLFLGVTSNELTTRHETGDWPCLCRVIDRYEADWPRSTSLRILIADDHDLLRDTVIAFVEASGGVSSVAASSLPEALSALDSHDRFDIVLLDYNMPGMNGLKGLERVLAHPAAERVALISGEAPREVVQGAMAAGAAGFVPKTLPARSLVNAIRFMVAGEQFVPADLLVDVPKERELHPIAQQLTKRELQVLEGLAEGKANKQIARDLALSEPTIKLHVKNLYRKIGAANRTQAALIAREAELF